MDHYILPLSNGTQVLFIPSPSAISHACVLIEAGSRDEPPGKAGLAHFIEHMLFKRTEKRSTSQILNRLELVGADLNAYTTKEYTCLHASFMKPHLRRSLDLFEDLLFHSVFPEEEIVKEKGVVTDEIHSYQDQPEDAINDDFEDLLFRGHPLGNNILGDLSSVAAFTRDDIMGFIRKNYRPDNIVIGITGNYSPVRIASLCEELFGNKKVADEQSARGGGCAGASDHRYPAKARLPGALRDRPDSIFHSRRAQDRLPPVE